MSSEPVSWFLEGLMGESRQPGWGDGGDVVHGRLLS